MRKKNTLAGAIAGAALTLGAAQALAAANCGDINASGGTPDAVDSVGLAQVVLGGGTPVAGHCGASGTLQCGDVVDDNVINSQDLVASLQIAAGIETLLTPCTGFGPTLACRQRAERRQLDPLAVPPGFGAAHIALAEALQGDEHQRAAGKTGDEGGGAVGHWPRRLATDERNPFGGELRRAG